MNEHIESAVAQFRTLLEEQLARTGRMENAAPAKDFTALPVVTIGVIDGDGIGPIISKQSTRVLEALLKDEIASGSIVLKPIEGLTIENRLAKGEAVPKDVLSEVKKCDVLLKGPTETPKGGTMESANVTLRRELDAVSHRAYASGFYFGEMKRHAPDDGKYLQDCVFVGVVKQRLTAGRVRVEQRNRVRRGDVLEVLSPGRLGLSFVAENLTDIEGREIDQAAVPMTLFDLDAPEGIGPGDMLRMRVSPAN